MATGSLWMLLVLLAVLSPGPSLADSEAAASMGKPIFVIGVDGLEWDLVLPLLQRGELPALAGLIARGSYGLLETVQPTISPSIWTSVATGKSSDKHGITSFTRPKGAGTDEELLNSQDRRTKAIWNIASDYDQRVAVVGWWMTYPVEPIHGVMVSQTNTSESFRKRHNLPRKGSLKPGLGRQVYPAAREEEILRVLTEVKVSLDAELRGAFGVFPNPLDELERKLWTKSTWSFRADLTYRRVAHRLLDDSDAYDLFLFYLSGADVYGHRFWRFRSPELFELKLAAESNQNFASVLDDAYRYIDEAVGELVSRAGPRARILVVSDHGMVPYNTRETEIGDKIPPSGHHKSAPPGVIIAAGPDLVRMPLPPGGMAALTRAKLRTLASILDITPTVLTLLGLPLGDDMDGEVATGLLSPSFLARRSSASVVSHDDADWLRARRAALLGSPGEAERLEQLRSLGYLE